MVGSCPHYQQRGFIMSWLVFFTAFFEFIKPFLSKLLELLFERLVKNRPDFNETNAREEIEKFFADAEKKLERWQIREILRLRAAKRATMKRIPELVAAAKAKAAALNITPLTQEELALVGDFNDDTLDDTAPSGGEQPE